MNPTAKTTILASVNPAAGVISSVQTSWSVVSGPALDLSDPTVSENCRRGCSPGTACPPTHLILSSAPEDCAGFEHRLCRKAVPYAGTSAFPFLTAAHALPRLTRHGIHRPACLQVRLSPSNSASLVLAPGALQPGATYVLRLSAEQQDSSAANVTGTANVLRGFADIRVRVSSIPRGLSGALGSFSVTPPEGIAMVDVFTMVASGWCAVSRRPSLFFPQTASARRDPPPLSRHFQPSLAARKPISVPVARRTVDPEDLPLQYTFQYAAAGSLWPLGGEVRRPAALR